MIEIQFEQEGERKPLSPEQQRILTTQAITHDRPGSILRDIARLLQFIQESAPVKVTGQHHLFPIKLLPALNAMCCHPLQLTIKRPHQKSYPNILGLYWVLRATGLVKLEGSGINKRYLAIDDAVFTQWNQFNPTERYCSLLEAWLLRGQAEMIGEQRGSFFSAPMAQWAQLFERLPSQGLAVADHQGSAPMQTVQIGYHILSVFRMFGFVEVVDARSGGPVWNVLTIHKTPFGEAMLSVLYDETAIAGELLMCDEHDLLATIGTLSPKLRPFFPEWQHILTLQHHSPAPGVYVFKVSIGSPWRRIAIPGSLTWVALSETILDAFDFDRDHLYQFFYTDRFGIERAINDPRMDEPQFAHEVTIQDIPLHVGHHLKFVYDFGDNWQFRMVLEGILPVDAGMDDARILETHGKSPEQYGGMW